MAGSLSQANYVAMAEALRYVDEAAGTITSLERQVDSHVTNLVSGWKGTASGQFAQLLQDWLSRFADIRAQLETMREKLGGTQRAYEATEQDQTQAVNSLSGILNHGGGGTFR